jgi:hypothetical protein
MQSPGIYFLEGTPVWDTHPASHTTVNNILNFVLQSDEQGPSSQSRLVYVTSTCVLMT